MAINALSKKIISIVLLIVVAAVFAFSAYTKLIAITPFEWSFIDLGFSSTLAAIAARVMVALELIIAIFLLLHLYLKKLTYPLAISLLIIFSIYLLIIMVVRGNDGNCGCFGDAFYMTPLEGLLKNLALIVLLIILYKFYPGRNFAHQMWVGLIVAMATLAGLFIALPMTQKAEPIELHFLYEPIQEEIPKIDLSKGKHIVAFLSLTCPHCVHAAQKMQTLYESDGSLPIYAVLNGKAENEASFYKQTGITFPHSRFRGPEAFIKMAGPYVPTIYYLNNGIREREINYMELNRESIHQWLKK